MKSTLTILMLLLAAPSFADQILAEISHDIDGDGDLDKFQFMVSDLENWRYPLVIYDNPDDPLPLFVYKEFEVNENGGIKDAEFSVNAAGAVELYLHHLYEHNDVQYWYTFAHNNGTLGLTGLSYKIENAELKYEAARQGIEFDSGKCTVNYLTGRVVFQYDDVMEEVNVPDLRVGMRMIGDHGIGFDDDKCVQMSFAREDEITKQVFPNVQ